MMNGTRHTHFPGPNFSYGSFSKFREDLISLTTNGEVTNFYNVPDIGFWYEDEGRILLPEEIEDDEKLLMIILQNNIDIEEVKAKTEKLKVYLDEIKANYPNFYKLFPLLAHSDCDGEIPHRFLSMILEGLIAAREEAIKIASESPEYDKSLSYNENFHNSFDKNFKIEFPIDGRICGFIKIIETALKKENSILVFC